MDETKQLCSLDKIATKKKFKSDCPQRLSDSLSRLMENQIAPRHTKFGPLIELWGELLPTELSRHCKVDEVSGGQLRVLVDSPTYMHELRLCGSQLLEQLQRHCPRARIEKIKFLINQTPKQNR